jgi:F-type H+-transporting ATPase subunit delta
VSVATVYAEALYESALEAGAVEAVAADVAGFARAVSESDELRLVLANPEVETRTKKQVVAALAEDAHPLVASFLQVLIDRGRIAELEEVAQAVEERVARAQGRLEVEAVTAVPLPADLRDRIVERIQQKTGSEVALTESVDPGVVGGLVLRVGGLVVDGSVRHRIEELRQAMRSAPVEAGVTAS